MKTEFQIRWKRVGLVPKARTFKTRKGANHMLTLLGPEPWKAWGQEATDHLCCSGFECGCGGVTVAEETERRREEMPVIEWIQVRVRAVNEWVEESKQLFEVEVEDDDPPCDGRAEFLEQCASIKTGLDASNNHPDFW